ncbi:3-oxoacyl-ACP reductase family protein [Vineibacter terrae]|uniref:SDR family NAD(P)-dependent oxidoreductase n=1 Tax=Vineibacter terrae TaxID=2586908 RepID=UPI002E2FDDD2|nr:3-oxoacyl-ACP reductase family protein [Vineibacter terrae]HEX2891471.1 3-oxoacyl-ACP reductase family protein [Vineibacter terrae]
MDRMFSLAGRTAIITGSGRNIGRDIARTFASAGAAVVVNGHRDEAALDGVVAEITQAGGRAMAVMADISDHKAVAAMVERASRTFGSVDIIVSNAAVRRHQPFLEISIEDWHRTIETNLSAAFYLTRAAIPHMVKRGWGRIINISGLDAFTGHYPDRVHNVVCKIGLVGIAKGLAREFGSSGITANVVSPGAIDTTRDWSQYVHFKPEEVVKQIPVGRMGKVGDVAAACLYLAADAGSFVTGQTLHVNGGQFMF